MFKILDQFIIIRVVMVRLKRDKAHPDFSLVVRL